MSDTKLCPRARTVTKKPRRFAIRFDPAVQNIAKRVVAGIDQKYDLHPAYSAYVKSCGKEEAERLIKTATEIEGACDVIQTEMDEGGVGLFGGLSEDGKEFIFYEWSTVALRVHMTHQEARDIVSGKKKYVTFFPCTEEHFQARKKTKEALRAQK